MNNFTLSQDGFASYTTVPNYFIEHYMPYAAGEFVKIYIYLLKCIEENTQELSLFRIADAFNDTEKDVKRALRYWEKKGLLELSYDDDTLTSIKIISLSDIRSEAKDYSKEKLVEVTSAESADDLSQLFYIAQKYLGRTLSSMDANTVVYICNDLGLGEELTEYLFEYCVSQGHPNMRYIEKTAISWAEKGIKTVKAAKNSAAIYSDSCYNVLKAFGLSGRQPTADEAEFVSRWINSYGFSLEMILNACNRTMNTIHQPSFKYTDSILQRWRSSNICSPEDIKCADIKFEEQKSRTIKLNNKAPVKKTAFTDFSQRDYGQEELDKLEKILSL